MARTKRRSKVRKARTTSTAFEPVWDETLEDPKVQIGKMLNWYHYHKSKKDALEYFEDFLKRSDLDKEKKKKIQAAGKGWVGPTLAWSCRIVHLHQEQGIEIPNNFQEFIDKQLIKLEEVGSCVVEEKEEEKEEEKDKKPKPTVQDYIQQQTDRFCGELDSELETFIENKCKNPIDIEKWLESNKVKSQQALDIAAFFQKYFDEYSEVLEGKDPELVEAYSHYTKPELKRLVKYLEGIIDTSKTWSKKAKILKAANRKPRKRKPKPPLKQVEKLNFLKETEEFGGLKSVPPTRIVGSTELWVFNTKTRVLGVYTCTNNHGFSIKGSTIQNFDVDQSICKKLRKPEDVIAEVMSLAKRGRNKILQKLSTREALLTGRINNHTILLRVEK